MFRPDGVASESSQKDGEGAFSKLKANITFSGGSITLNASNIKLNIRAIVMDYKNKMY